MRRRLSIVIALVAVSACATSLKVDQTLPSSFGDLAAIKTIEITTQAGDVLLRGTFEESGEVAGKIERTATLVSPTNSASRGSVSMELDRTEGLSDEEVTVKLRDLPYPASCRLLADGHEMTLFDTTKEGALEFRFARRVTLTNGAGK